MGHDEQREEIAAKGWETGKTFFEESEGKPAKAAGGPDIGQATDRGDAGFPASEAGAGIIPEDQDGSPDDVHLPASEADTGAVQDSSGGEPQSWPGKGGPGTIPPPG